MTYAVIEACGLDWYLSSVTVSRYRHFGGVFTDWETGEKWVGREAFAAHLRSLT